MHAFNYIYVTVNVLSREKLDGKESSVKQFDVISKICREGKAPNPLGRVDSRLTLNISVIREEILTVDKYQPRLFRDF